MKRVMERIVSPIVLAIMILLWLTSCGEKPCNHEGNMRYENNGSVYRCADRHDGNGLRWYKE